jgi:hypothetical protein
MPSHEAMSTAGPYGNTLRWLLASTCYMGAHLCRAHCVRLKQGATPAGPLFAVRRRDGCVGPIRLSIHVGAGAWICGATVRQQHRQNTGGACYSHSERSDVKYTVASKQKDLVESI